MIIKIYTFNYHLSKRPQVGNLEEFIDKGLMIPLAQEQTTYKKMGPNAQEGKMSTYVLFGEQKACPFDSQFGNNGSSTMTIAQLYKEGQLSKKDFETISELLKNKNAEFIQLIDIRPRWYLGL